MNICMISQVSVETKFFVYSFDPTVVFYGIYIQLFRSIPTGNKLAPNPNVI
jgi:hypothetical protein